MIATLVAAAMLVLSLQTTTVFAADDATTAHDHVAIYENLAEWIKANGGIVTDKQEYRLEDPQDPTSFGVFAKEKIAEGEILCHIPWKCILTAGTDTFDSALHCDTARKLMGELQTYLQQEEGSNDDDKTTTASESFYAPYVKYLASLPKNAIPSVWTDAGKDLLELVLATDLLPPSDPIQWIDGDWKDDCSGSDDDPLEAHAAMLVLSKGDDDRMVPIMDMYNHRNGPWFNTDNVFKKGAYVQMVASRDIDVDEQIYFSYNMCSDCQNRAKNYGAPELFRDYGFVEKMPQRWTFFPQKLRFDLYEDYSPAPKADDDDEDDDSGKPKEVKLQWRKDSSKEPSAFAHLRMQLKRLDELVKPHLENVTETKAAADGESADQSNLPTSHELRTIWEYYNAITLAMSKALEEYMAEEGSDTQCPGGTVSEDGTCLMVVKDGYSDFRVDDYDDHNYQHTCDNKKMMKFKDYDDLVSIKSVYQQLNFCRRPTDKNICFDLDDTVQICSNYRPHYHEYAAHLPARFMSTIKRAVFVGGGDSMLLHELRKYPDIELILGLELDQTVVRSSFKYFKTQPHFDDERVQWWFGDATKSLLMLPKSYFQSFDLVLVDLSETVMSFTVTKDLDMLQALALLIKPDGVFVKNEQYFDKIGEMFDYSMQSYFPNNPIICDQAYSMGSNKIDFLHPNVDNIVKGHGVEMLLLEEIDDPDDRFDHIQYYQKTSAREQGKCNETDTDESDMKLKRAGVLMILEAENANSNSLKGAKLEGALQSALKKEGLRVLSATTHSAPLGEDGNMVVIVMQEGFVTARTWPKEKYCAFDIYLWGRFLAMDKVKKALSDAVGSKKDSLSSFRIVVGGMRGADTWAEDRELIGPRLVQQRNCKEDAPVESSVKGAIDPALVDIALDKSLKMILDKDILAAVLCGTEDQPCNSFDVLSANPKVRDVLVLRPCADIEKAPFLDDSLTPMFKCEMEMASFLRNWVATNGKLSAVAVDPNANIGMVQVLERIMRNGRNRKRLLMPHVGFFVPIVDMTQEWRRNFLEKSRSYMLEYDDVGRAEVVLESKSDAMEMSFLTTNDAHFFVRVLNVTEDVERSTGLEADIPMLKGQPMKWQDYQPREFLPEDYDPKPAEEQFAHQRPLGHQMILQLKLAERKGAEKTEIATTLTTAMEQTLKDTLFTTMETKVFDTLGTGLLVVIVAAEGSAIAVYDGKSRLTVDFFTYDLEGAKSFVDDFLANLPRAKVLLRDEHPRGVGRVVNFLKDLENDDSKKEEEKSAVS